MRREQLDQGLCTDNLHKLIACNDVNLVRLRLIILLHENLKYDIDFESIALQMQTNHLQLYLR